jgi:hypothetical protein
MKKIKIKFLVVSFFSVLDHQTLDPDPGSGSAIRKNAGSGSALNQCGSETLDKAIPVIIKILKITCRARVYYSGGSNEPTLAPQFE